MSVIFDDWKYETVSKLFIDRRAKYAAENNDFYNGEHWQSGKGFIGQMPDRAAGDYFLKLSDIKAGFQVENVIKAAVDTHLGGAFGREPTMDFVPRETEERPRRTLSAAFRRLASAFTRRAQTEGEKDERAAEADEAFTEWWDKQRIHTLIRNGAKQALLEETTVYRFYVPPGLRDLNGAVPTQRSMGDAIRFIHLKAYPADVAAVFTDEETESKVGVFLYRKDNKNFAELSYLDDDGFTVVRQVEENSNAVRGGVRFNLGGHLTMFEIKREPLITEPVRGNQRALNLALTQLMRNVNLAGSRERVFLNAEAPGKWVDSEWRDWVEGTSTGTKEWLASPYYTGAGVTNFVKGSPIRNEQGQITGLANPNLNVLEPVAIDTFVGTRDTFRSVIFGQCRMLHVLIADNATATGRSREQARAEYESDLKITKGVFDQGGRWIAESVIYFAAQFSNRSNDFLSLRAEFNTLISTGPVSPTERQENRADVEKGILSKETARSRGGVDDPGAEAERIKQEREEESEGRGTLALPPALDEVTTGEAIQ